MSTSSTLPTESLRCPACDHSLTTAKTLGKPDSLDVKCPKCQASSTLNAWRSSLFEAYDSPPALPDVPAVASLNPKVSDNQTTLNQSETTSVKGSEVAGSIADGFWQLGLFFLAGVLGLPAIIATLLFLIGSFSQSPIVQFNAEFASGITANVIQEVKHELTLIRYLIVAVVFWFLTASVVKISQKHTTK